MTTRFRFVLVAFVLATLIAVSLEHSRADGETSKSPGQVQPSNSELAAEAVAFGAVSRDSRPGEIASGSESGYVPGQRIVLNIRPCRGTDGEFVSFRWPFKRNVVGSVNCGGSQVAIVQIEQR
ncbi:MAG TPA: hypothetical protein VN937_05820 [Blastocatellia bacterium]|nr:hypothetical protein [Blastocatellia bacterium]